MKFAITFLFGLSVFMVACSQPQPTPTPFPTATISPTITIQETGTPTATVTLVPTPFPTRNPLDLIYNNPKLISDPELAIAFSFNLLMLLGYERGFSYNNALYTPIEFPSRMKGTFVAIGFSGTTRGYRLLYQMAGDQFKLMQVDEGVDWGENWGSSPELVNGRVDLKFPELLHNANGKPIQLIEVSGVAHGGTGLIEDGITEILRIDDDGFKVIFSGAKLIGNYNSGGLENTYQFKYVDLDGDGNKEIVKMGRECKIIQDPVTTWKPVDCKPIHEIYKYNGEQYVKQP